MKMFRPIVISFCMCAVIFGISCMKQESEKNIFEWTKKFQEGIQKEIDSFFAYSTTTNNPTTKREVFEKEVNNGDAFGTHCENIQNVLNDAYSFLKNVKPFNTFNNDFGIYINHEKIKSFSESEKTIFAFNCVFPDQIDYGSRNIFFVNCDVKKDIKTLGKIVLINTPVHGDVSAKMNIVIVNSSGKDAFVDGNVLSTNSSVDLIGIQAKNVTARTNIGILSCCAIMLIHSFNGEVYVLLKSKTGKIKAKSDIYLDYNSTCGNDKFGNAVSASGKIYTI